MRTTYTQVIASKNDPEVFRAYMAQNYGGVFTYGASSSTFSVAIRMAKLCARACGITFDEVVETAKADFAVIDA